MKIDIGSGGFKRDGFIGVDNFPGEGTDVLCDLETQPLPFEENSVDYIFSSHCFEHVKQDRLVAIFTEFSRVCRDGATIEIWNPYAFHRDGYVLGHITFLTEEIYHHLCGLQDTWAPTLGARWDLKEIRYHVRPDLLANATALGMSEDFAITHLNQMVKEFGVFIEINKARPPNPHAPLRMLIDEIPSIPMRESRNLNRRPIGHTAKAETWGGLIAAILAERDAANKTRDAALAERDALLRSTSWKITAPLRTLSSAVRRTARLSAA